jgi:hypothetical protein
MREAFSGELETLSGHFRGLNRAVSLLFVYKSSAAAGLRYPTLPVIQQDFALLCRTVREIVR